MSIRFNLCSVFCACLPSLSLLLPAEGSFPSARVSEFECEPYRGVLREPARGSRSFAVLGAPVRVFLFSGPSPKKAEGVAAPVAAVACFILYGCIQVPPCLFSSLPISPGCPAPCFCVSGLLTFADSLPSPAFPARPTARAECLPRMWKGCARKI